MCYVYKKTTRNFCVVIVYVLEINFEELIIVPHFKNFTLCIHYSQGK